MISVGHRVNLKNPRQKRSLISWVVWNLSIYVFGAVGVHLLMCTITHYTKNKSKLCKEQIMVRGAH